VRLALVPPGVGPQRDDRLVVLQASLDGAHEGGLPGAPVAEDANREPRAALADDSGERPGVLVEPERGPLGRLVEKDPVVVPVVLHVRIRAWHGPDGTSRTFRFGL
jgi:hypothetical protein